MRKVSLLIAILPLCLLLFAQSPQTGLYGGDVEVVEADTVSVANGPGAQDSSYTLVEWAFINIPDTILPLISRSTRMDMLDYFRVDSTYRATNEMGGYSSLEKVSGDYLKVRISDVSTLELKVLPWGKSGRVIASVYTICGPAADSELRFFSPDMKPVKCQKFFKLPELKDFFSIPKGSLTKMKEIEAMVPFPTIEYDLSENSCDLTGRLTAGEYINQDDYNIMKLFLRPSLQWRWNGSKFELEKK